ncbi:MAG: methyltransferase [bacterium]
MDALGLSKDADISPQLAMRKLMAGFQVSRVLHVAAELGIADLLADGPRSSDELAGSTGTHAPALHRVLRALVSLGVFAEDERGRFTLTPLGATLRTGVPGSVRALALLILGGEHYQAWSDLMYSVRTGGTALDHVLELGIWDYYAKDQDRAKIFNEAMENLKGLFDEAVVASYSFCAFGTVVDVGGGNGSLMAMLLKANPRLKGMVFDLPRVAEVAKRRIAQAGLTERCKVVGGDAFVSVPSGGDAYVLSRVIHDWDDAHSIAILKNCRRAISETGRVLLLERVLPLRIDQSPTTQAAVLGDVNMLAVTGGRERTESEYRTLYDAAGFRLTRVIPTPSGISVIEGAPGAMS